MTNVAYVSRFPKRRGSGFCESSKVGQHLYSNYESKYFFLRVRTRTMARTRKTLVSFTIAGLLAGGMWAGATSAAFAAINPGCSITPLVPYKSGSSFVYGGSVGCSSAVASRIDAVGQRQSTLSWVNIGSTYKTSSGTTSLSVQSTGSLISGTSTYRSQVKGTSKDGGTSTVNSSGQGIQY